jgi:hypothetical protein
MKDLPQPLMTWLNQSFLTPENNGHCLLFVDPRSIDFVKDIYNLTKIYPLVKSMYPDMLSLHVLSLPIKKLVEEDILSFYSVKAFNS